MPPPSASFSIGGLSVKLEAVESSFFAELRTDWRQFARVGGGETIALQCELTDPIDRPANLIHRMPAIFLQLDRSLRLDGDGFYAEVSADRSRGWVRQPPERFPTEAVVRVLVAESLINRGGMLIHGVALAYQGKAALFTGVSGAGKSTLGKWATQGGLTLLADELVAVLPDGDGFAVHGTPWNIGTNASARLTHIGVLAHTPGAQLKPVPASTVLRVLLSNVLEPGDTPEIRARLFQIASKVLSSIPTYELGFAPNLEVAAVLRDALGK